MKSVPGRYFTKLPDGRLRCELCPRDCTLKDGQRGLCFVRAREGDSMMLTTWGRSSGFCVDPIEKKPLNHFLPGSAVLSFGTAGCNLTCSFCQNWEMSKSRQIDTLAQEATPERITEVADSMGCRSVAFTYNDPVIFLEYAVDTAAACRAQNIKTVAVTAGYIYEKPREEFFSAMDAVNVDLKAFTEEFYKKQCSAKLGAVLDTLRYIRHETNVWLEITTLLIPGLNDSDEELTAMAQWVADKLGVDVPWHFSAFHPDYKLTHINHTPSQTLLRARRIAQAAGHQYVYTGNIRDVDSQSTYCHQCDAILIGRSGYEITGWNLTPQGACHQCGTPCAGVFEAQPGDWGNKRLPVLLGQSAPAT